MADETPSRRPVMAAVAVGGLLLTVFGLSYRVLAERLAVPSTADPITQAEVDRFPMDVGQWKGEELPLDEVIIQATDTDAHISRRYSRRGGLESVTLWVACGVRVRDLMPHRPDVCYTGNGWTLAERQVAELSLDDGTKLPCNVMQFRRGALNVQRTVVLYYYLVDGQYNHDVSTLRWKAWRGAGTVKYVAQVQIVAPVSATLTAESAVDLVQAFALESALPIAELFESRNHNTDSEEAGTDPAPAREMTGGPTG